jgi:hypothetical protein
MTCFTCTSQNEAIRLARRVFWLAYQASIPMGMGCLHMTNTETEDSIWAQITQGIVCGQKLKLYADYICGRMMKLGLMIDNCTVSHTGGNLNSDYQSWSTTYLGIPDLFSAANTSLSKDTQYEIEKKNQIT